MKKSEYIFKITTPCSAEWQSMTAGEDGNYCSQCAKNVVDFTGMSDTQVVQRIKNESGKICGRFNAAQLNRAMMETGRTSANSAFRRIAAAISILTATTAVAAQTPVPAPAVEMQINAQQADGPAKDKTPEPKKRQTISGTVFNNSVRIPGCRISLADTKLVTQTNAKGEFELVIPDNLLKQKMKLIISGIGYETRVVVIAKKDLPLDGRYELKESSIVLGRVAIVQQN